MITLASLCAALPILAVTSTSDTTLPGATLLKANGGWCWYQGPRAIVTRDKKVILTSISGDSYADFDAGDLWVTSWDLPSKNTTHTELKNKFQCEDHDVAGLLERPDGRILAIYGKHGGDQLQRWKITTKPNDIASWSDEKTLKTGAAYTYSNVYQLSGENNRIYNFSRSKGYNPNCTYSEDDGETWQYGWRLLHWTKNDYKNDPNYTHSDGSRPSLRYTSNNKDTIHFVTTEDHPRAYDNSIYHGFYRGGKLHDSSGKVLNTLSSPNAKRLTPKSFTCVFEGGKDKVAWTTDLALDDLGLPYTAFSVQVDGAGARGKRLDNFGNDHRYWYARFDGKQWNTHEIAYAGTKLYTKESDYTGLIALDPNDPDTVVISTNANLSTGKPLISKTDQKRHWELYRGKTSDKGTSWTWTALTNNSTVDNLRPIIPSNPGSKRVILWCRGNLTSFKNYRLDIYGLIENR